MARRFRLRGEDSWRETYPINWTVTTFELLEKLSKKMSALF